MIIGGLATVQCGRKRPCSGPEEHSAGRGETVPSTAKEPMADVQLAGVPGKEAVPHTRSVLVVM